MPPPYVLFFDGVVAAKIADTKMIREKDNETLIKLKNASKANIDNTTYKVLLVELPRNAV